MKKKKSLKFYKILSFILVLFSVAAASVLVYFDAIPYKYLIPGFIILGVIVFFICLKLNRKTCLFTKLVCCLFSAIFLVIETFGIIYAFGTIEFFNDIFDTGLRNETYSVYVLENSDYKKLSDLKNKKIVVYKSGEESLTKALEKLDHKLNYEKIDNDSLYDSVDSVKNKKADALFVSESLMKVYLDEHENTKLKLLSEIDIITKNNGKFKSVNVAKKPFVVYLSGVDTTGSINKVSRSDVNLLAFINPNKGKILVVGTPRDYYVTLATKKAKDKLTHAGIYGIEESALTLGLLYDTEVNYYARVNFTSFVNIVDKLGKIEVNVEKPDYRNNAGIDCGANTVCEQNSNRAFGSSTVYVKAGKQSLSGEQALAYARNRHQYNGGDNARQKHQQDVIKGILDKVTSPSILTKYNSVLKGVSKGILTNIDEKTITRLVNLQLDENIKWDVESINVTGTDSYNVTYSTGKAKAYVMEPDEKVITDTKAKIKVLMSEE